MSSAEVEAYFPKHKHVRPLLYREREEMGIGSWRHSVTEDSVTVMLTVPKDVYELLRDQGEPQIARLLTSLAAGIASKKEGGG